MFLIAILAGFAKLARLILVVVALLHGQRHDAQQKPSDDEATGGLMCSHGAHCPSPVTGAPTGDRPSRGIALCARGVPGDWCPRSMGDHDTHRGELCPDDTVGASYGVVRADHAAARAGLAGHPPDPKRRERAREVPRARRLRWVLPGRRAIKIDAESGPLGIVAHVRFWRSQTLRSWRFCCLTPSSSLALGPVG